MTRLGLPPCPYGLRPVSRLALAALIAAALVAGNLDGDA